MERDSDISPERLPLRLQLMRLQTFANSIHPLALILTQIDDLLKIEKTYSKCVQKLNLLERTSTAVLPFLRFPKLIKNQIEDLLNEIDSRTREWTKRIYRPHYPSIPSFSDIKKTQKSMLSLQSSIGSTLVPAHEIMNASSLRAILWALLLALWERVRERRGGLSCILMDDPQAVFDQNNALTFTSNIPELSAAGMRTIIASHDQTFIYKILATARAKQEPSLTRYDISPISSSKMIASLTPKIKEIENKHTAWKEDENNKTLATDFIDSVRIYFESTL